MLLSTKDQIDLIHLLASDYEYNVELIQPYHVRISLGKKRLDYFPNSRRATWVSSQKWFTIEDIELFIKENFA